MVIVVSSNCMNTAVRMMISTSHGFLAWRDTAVPFRRLMAGPVISAMTSSTCTPPGRGPLHSAGPERPDDVKNNRSFVNLQEI
jgi:hypothetical protein